MTTINNQTQEKIAKKQTLLNNSRQILKKEFVGIDPVIDSVINSLSTWYLFPELQERPLIINLWGMTGVGKTALIFRLAALLEYDKKLFRFDMGNNSGSKKNMKDALKEIFSHDNGAANMLMMDEFQYAKTINEEDYEIENPFSRILWDLLDSGKFEANRNADVDIEAFVRLKQMLEQCIKEGVKVKNGLVVEKEKLFMEIIMYYSNEDFSYENPKFNHEVEDIDKTKYYFLPITAVRELFKYYPKKDALIFEFRRRVYGLDELQTIDLLDKIIEHSKSNKIIDCSKTLIFVLGNLDDAYKMSSSFNPDINANDFHEASKTININHIKRALKNRFRNEQIARLGNNHIIYPAFSEASFYKLIDLELDRITANYQEKFSIKLQFKNNLKKLIYDEGVFPAQGTRPLFSTIYKLVNSKIPILISENILHDLHAHSINCDFINGKLTYEYYKNSTLLHTFEETIELNLSELRKPAKDDMQAIIAVHEAGHAVISMALLKVIPEYIHSTSADVTTGGMVIIKRKWKQFSREELPLRIAEFLGGIIAEKIVFGIDKITLGGITDLEEATSLAVDAIKQHGMGSLLANIKVPNTHASSYLDINGDYNTEVKKLLESAATLAETTLQKEKTLLLQMANYLSDERLMKKEMIEQNARDFGSEELKNTKFIQDGNHLYYRNKLKQLAICNSFINSDTLNNGQINISLNKTID